MKEKKEKARKLRRPSRIVFCLMTVLFALVIAVNAVIFIIVRPYFGLINNFLSKKESTQEMEDTAQASRDITQEVEEEGIILLKNDGTLSISDPGKINVFGAGIKNFVYGGTGSGAGDSSTNVTLVQGLENAGFAVNGDLVQFYEDNAQSTADMGLVGTDFSNYEVPVDQYSDDLLQSAKDFSDTAVIVISRVGGEGSVLPMDMEGCTGGDAGKSFLELQQNEIDLVSMVEKNFDNIIVILNASNAMELGFLEDDAIDSAIWVGCPGSTGCNAIGEVLAGTVNPSGRTVDTFPYEVESAPSYYSFGGYDYTNATYQNSSLFAGTGTADASDTKIHYVDYIEGIYVGYRYYETAAEEGYIDYDDVVQYPFGYGLSYTTFKESIENFTADGSTVTMDVKVTNTGDVAGKDVVEAYYSAPYTKGGIEKSSVVLAAFDKTDLLDPQESQTITLSWNYEDMASYDYTGVKAEGGAYVLEKGEYQINLQSDSHDVIDSRTLTVDRDIIYNDENDGKRSSDETEAVNLFDDVSFGDDITHVSRADFAGTMPTERAPETREATDEQIAAFAGSDLDNSETEDIVYKNNHLKLSDMKGLDYDDPKWELLLEQLSLSDMELLVSNGGWGTFAISSIGKPYLSDSDGPNGVNNIMSGDQGTQYTGQSVLGYTWNQELAERVGEALASEAIAHDLAGLYAPGLNIHRSPFGGRNYEYVSEDGFLTGKIVAAEVRGIQSKGVYVYAKHFVANDQETNRDQGGLVTWLNEQALREVYARGFEILVKESDVSGIMSSFNRIGATPTAESYPLLTSLLRNEWGFHGCVITDCVMACTTQDINKALRAGNDLQLTILGQLKLTDDTTKTAAGHKVLRRASHDILYMIANSNAIENAPSGVYGFAVILGLVGAGLCALFVLYYVRRHKKMKAWKESQVEVLSKQ